MSGDSKVFLFTFQVLACIGDKESIKIKVKQRSSLLNASQFDSCDRHHHSRVTFAFNFSTLFSIQVNYCVIFINVTIADYHTELIITSERESNKVKAENDLLMMYDNIHTQTQ